MQGLHTARKSRNKSIHAQAKARASLPSPLSDPVIGKAHTLPHTKRHSWFSECIFCFRSGRSYIFSCKDFCHFPVITMRRLSSSCFLPSSKGRRSNQSESLSRITSPISAVEPVATSARFTDPTTRAWQPCHSRTMLDAAEIGDCACGTPRFLFF